MTEPEQQETPEELSEEELERQRAEGLPDREVMTVIDPGRLMGDNPMPLDPGLPQPIVEQTE